MQCAQTVTIHPRNLLYSLLPKAVQPGEGPYRQKKHCKDGLMMNHGHKATGIQHQ